MLSGAFFKKLASKFQISAQENSKNLEKIGRSHAQKSFHNRSQFWAYFQNRDQFRSRFAHFWLILGSLLGRFLVTPLAGIFNFLENYCNFFWKFTAVCDVAS